MDGLLGVRDSVGMIAQHYRLYIERKEADQNMARFYVLSIEETLFGQIRLVRSWGRIGTRGKTVQHSFDSEEDAIALFLRLLKSKKTRGYRPRLCARCAERLRLVDIAAPGSVRRAEAQTK